MSILLLMVMPYVKCYSNVQKGPDCLQSFLQLIIQGRQPKRWLDFAPHCQWMSEWADIHCVKKQIIHVQFNSEIHEYSQSVLALCGEMEVTSPTNQNSWGNKNDNAIMVHVTSNNSGSITFGRWETEFSSCGWSDFFLRTHFLEHEIHPNSVPDTHRKPSIWLWINR